ncbi:DHHC-type zinc finger family protein [Actinidia rufa]|uniref:DHHC-type zinc finger family protein n=1 Tax=Actinidia rufa TaxID=165716 RepID=A0A7J0E8C0_9ERIC|nr:DHHC-type zinc finger family protein [Actinidia rufa]
MKQSCRFSLPVTVVISVIGYIYASTVFVFVNQWFGLRSSPGIMNAAAFTAVALMCTVNYAVAIFTDPGRIPATFMPDIEDADNPIHEIKRKVFAPQSI